MNKLLYLVQSILKISKTLMYEFLYGYVEYRGKGKLCDMNTDSLTVCIKTEDGL